MSRLAAVYRRKGALFVAASHKTEAGFWVEDKVITIVEARDGAATGKAVVEALARSMQGVPTPERDTDLVGPLLLAAGVSSWNTFSKLARCVDVHLQDGIFEITPYRNMGGSDGFVPMTDKVVELPEGSSDIGQAVLAALEVAQ